MEFVNYFTGQDVRPLNYMESFVLMLSPMAPHISEELWQVLGNTESLAYAPWPKFDPRHVKESTIELPVQINGKVRGRITVAVDAANDEIERMALADTKVKRYLEGKTVRKFIIVPRKLINIVVG